MLKLRIVISDNVVNKSPNNSNPKDGEQSSSSFEFSDVALDKGECLIDSDECNDLKSLHS